MKLLIQSPLDGLSKENRDVDAIHGIYIRRQVTQYNSILQYHPPLLIGFFGGPFSR